MVVYVLQDKDGKYYNGTRDIHRRLNTTYDITNAYLCRNIHEADILLLNEEGFSILPFYFSRAEDIVQAATGLRAFAIQCGKDPSMNECVAALDGIDIALVGHKYPELIESL